ncbi:hypothetical protein DEA8626_03244 [Defluviimonas aquaemixtae]|uniref:Uncharacterized protein n=1 Tax=Albidovulum aquaemixtae TaxID=1542388 RepID=A0A2R8BLF3_9RHOB|nr:glycosyltransferase family 2 protein [Defluviimonas aquaemixtae]SPH24195.1 hypothetical protein DEA8626_03244 [Defluviimonas aquaemixtae]
MTFASLDDFLAGAAELLAKGPVALIFAEDAVEIASSVRHHANIGFAEVIVFLPEALAIPAETEEAAHWVRHDSYARDQVVDAVNAVAAAAPPSTWLYYCYNAEYLFFPFCEDRRIGEMLAFHAEERRAAMLCYVVDLYAPDLDRDPNAVNLNDAMLDRSGYYALGRPDPATGHPKERQLDFFGGLRWRFEEHIPKASRRIDRIAIFRPRPGLSLREDHTFNVEEYNTYACPWHHNLTAAIASFRTAKALKTNPGSMFDIWNFTWHNSAPFEWRSQQLMDLGLMEPGQWF